MPAARRPLDGSQGCVPGSVLRPDHCETSCGVKQSAGPSRSLEIFFVHSLRCVGAAHAETAAHGRPWGSALGLAPGWCSDAGPLRGRVPPAAGQALLQQLACCCCCCVTDWSMAGGRPLSGGYSVAAAALEVVGEGTCQ